jgi:nitrogen-specific signal transduction histidine kinase
MILTETASLLTSSPGSMAYHVVLVTLLAVMLALANAAMSSVDDEVTRRWALASGGMLTCRLLGMIAAGLAWLLVIDGNVFLPAMERFLNLVGVAVFAWVVLVPRLERTADVLLFVVLIAAILGLAATFFVLLAELVLPPFNQSLADAGWAFSGAAIALAAGIALVVRKPPAWRNALAAFVALTTGYAFHIALGPVEGDLPGFVRWGEMAAYPLLALTSVRVFQRMQISPEPELEPEPDARHRAEAWPPYEAIQQLSRLISQDTPESMAEAMVSSVASAMRAEVCLLLTPPDSGGSFSVAKGYDLIKEQNLPGVPLNQEACPVIYSAFAQRQPVRLPPNSRAPDLETLRTKLSLMDTGPLLMAPLIDQERIIGGLLLLSPFVRERWLDEDVETIEQIAGHLASRFRQLQARTEAAEPQQRGEAGEALREARSQIETLEAERARLIEEARAEFKKRKSNHEAAVRELKQKNEAALGRIQELDARLTELQSEARAADKPTPSEEPMGVVTPDEVAAARASAQAQDATAVSEQVKRAVVADLDAIASVALNLRHPMSTVLGYAELMLTENTGPLTDTQRRLLGQLVDAVERMQTLADQLNRYALVDTGILGMTTQQVDLLDAFERIVTQLGEPLRSKRIALRMDIPDELPPVESDPAAIQQILTNLLTNAIDSSPTDEEIVLAARVQEAEQAEYLLLTVSNLGEGIPAEELSMLYSKPGDREAGPPAVEDAAHGRLVVVQALVQAIGGRVWFDSEVGVGTTVTILLSLLQAEHEQGAANP